MMQATVSGLMRAGDGKGMMALEVRADARAARVPLGRWIDIVIARGLGIAGCAGSLSQRVQAARAR
jgi:hypothetical protein